jgi:hypothetical protein
MQDHRAMANAEDQRVRDLSGLPREKTVPSLRESNRKMRHNPLHTIMELQQMRRSHLSSPV